MHRIGRTNDRSRRRIAVSAALVLAAPAGAAPNPNLIDRPSFEIAFSDPLAQLYAPGSHIGPWKVSA